MISIARTRTLGPLRKGLTMILHWTLFLLVWTIALAGRATTNPAPEWLGPAYAIVGGGFVALAVIFGMLNRPGPKLQGWIRPAHVWAHRALYALVAWSAAAYGAEWYGQPLPGPTGREMIPAVLAATMLHAVYHMWRHTTLLDGALRLMTPKAIHHIL